MLASIIISFIQFLGTHQSSVAVYCVFAMALAGYLVNEAMHEMRPRLAPINMHSFTLFFESGGHWHVVAETKLLDWSR